MIIAVFGLPGSGKSYFAERLTQRIQAVYISSDVIRKQLSDNPDYSPDQKLGVYQQMVTEMERHILEGKNVVLDATFYRDTIRKHFIERVHELQEKIVFIEIQAAEHIIKERLAKPRKYSDADFEVYKKVKNEFEPLKTKHLILTSTNENIEQMLLEALSYLRKDKMK